MAINPITVEKLKTFLLVGHSNADGNTNYAALIANDPNLRTIGDWQTEPHLAYYKNVYVLTSAQPFPDEDNSPVASLISDVAWLELTVANPDTPAAPHPHESPWNFPNNRGDCQPRWLYASWPDFDPQWSSGVLGVTAFPLTFPTPNEVPEGTYFNQPFPSTVIGVEIPFSMLWKNYWGAQVGMVKLASGASYLLPIEMGSSGTLKLDPFCAGTAGFTPDNPGYVRSAVTAWADSRRTDYSPLDEMTTAEELIAFGENLSPGLLRGARYAYWTPADAFDFAPYSDRFYKMLIDKITAGVEALPSGTTLDIQGVIPWMGDNDSQVRTKEFLQSNWENTVRAFVKRLRYDIYENGWTSMAREQIPIMWPSVHPGYPGPDDDETFSSVDFCNAVLDQIALDDPYFKKVDSTDWATMDDDGEQWFSGLSSPINAGTINHIGTTGYIQAADDIFDAWLETQTEPVDAVDIDDCITVDEAMTRIRVYLGKGTATGDYKATELIQHLDASYQHVLNHVGDNAWWRRNRHSFTLTKATDRTVTLPKNVHRLMRIEAPFDPTYPVQWELVGFADGGKMQITMHERAGGTYICHYITKPGKLTVATQKIPVPTQILEWIIVEACRRVTATGANVALMAHFAGQAQQLMSDSMRNMGQMQRGKRDRLRTQRRAPRFSYRYRYRPWDGG